MLHLEELKSSTRNSLFGCRPPFRGKGEGAEKARWNEGEVEEDGGAEEERKVEQLLSRYRSQRALKPS